MEMKFTKLIFTTLTLALFTAWNSFAQSGIYESYIVLNLNGGGNTFYDMQAATGNPDFNGASLGTFACNGSLVIAGGENKTFKCSPCNILNSTLFYRVWTGSPSGTFTGINLPFNANLGTGCGGNDQKWQQMTNTANIITGLAPGNYTLEVYSTSGYDGCGTGTHFSSNGGANYAATFVVGPAPAVAASASPATICQGASATLTGTGATTYSWMPGSLTGTTVSVSPGTTTTYTVTGTDGTTGCTATATVEVTVTPAPACQNGGTVDLTSCSCLCLSGYAGVLCETQCATSPVAGSNSPVCETSNLNLTSSAAGTGPLTYSWTGPNGFTSSLQNPVIAGVTAAAAGTYNVTISNTCGTVNASTVVTVNPNPVIITGVKSDAAIAGSVGTAGITTLPAGCTYLWSPGGQTTNYIQNQTPGTYQVTITAPGGCTKVQTLIIN